MHNNIKIRVIRKEDNYSLSKIIKSTLEEFDAAIEGTAYTDKETNAMFDAYAGSKSVYYVALLDDQIIAGCGINPLQNVEKGICELQKMYMSPNARGKKIGKTLLSHCLGFAKKAGYNQCYLETFPNMTSAIALYKKNGFYIIDHALGNTCHYSCNVWMLKDL
jgi:putative acetyltransferase